MTTESMDLRELYERFERDQLDLDVLCAPSPSRSREFWAGNADYGNASVLKLYAGIPEHLPTVRAVIPHGIYLNVDAVSPAERDSRLPAVLVFPPSRASAYHRHADMVTIPFASPFVYANRLIDYDGPRRGTLFFLAHSSPVLHVKVDWEALADELLEWPERMWPITVMVYWQDYLLGHHRSFVDRGFPVSSAGHSGDSEFLLRLAYLLRKHEYAAGNAVGAHMFYSVHVGCPFQVVQTDHDYVSVDQQASSALAERLPSSIQSVRGVRDDLVSSFAAPVKAVTPEQRDLADYYLGTAHALSPSEMADFLRWLVRLDRFGRVMLLSSTARRVDADGAAVRTWVPCAIRRFCARMRGALHTLVTDPTRFVRRLLSFLER